MKKREELKKDLDLLLVSYNISESPEIIELFNSYKNFTVPFTAFRNTINNLSISDKIGRAHV